MREFLIPLGEICDRYEAGENLRQLAEAAGTSSQTIGRRLRMAGVALRSRGANSEELRNGISERRKAHIPEHELRGLHARQMSCREIASILGWDEETIRQRLIDLGLPRLPAKARPEKNYFWRGGYTVDSDGYILEKTRDHPKMDRHGYVRQHRLVMEWMLRRYLLSREVVDHRNGDPCDNRPDNLRLFASNAEHLRVTLKEKKKLPKEERERLRREAVQRARQRVAAILAESGNDADR